MHACLVMVTTISRNRIVHLPRVIKLVDLCRKEMTNMIFTCSLSAANIVMFYLEWLI